MRRVYRLFGIPVWTIESDEPAAEPEIEVEAEDEPSTERLETSHTLSDGKPPTFGFTPWTPDYMDWDD